MIENGFSDTGIAGTTLAFVDYAKEFPYFRQEVLPRFWVNQWLTSMKGNASDSCDSLRSK